MVDTYAGPMSGLMVGLILSADAEQTGILVFTGRNGWRCGSDTEIWRMALANFDFQGDAISIMFSEVFFLRGAAIFREEDVLRVEVPFLMAF